MTDMRNLERIGAEAIEAKTGTRPLFIGSAATRGGTIYITGRTSLSAEPYAMARVDFAGTVLSVEEAEADDA